MSLTEQISILVKKEVRELKKELIREITLYTEEEAMRLLRVADPRVMTHYRQNGLAYLNVRPRKYTSQDIRNFINKKKRITI